MAKKLSDETIEEIQRLRKNGVGIREIARQVGTTPGTVFRYTTAREKGFASGAEYEDARARERGFASRQDYRDHQARERGFASQSAYNAVIAKQEGYGRPAYRNQMAVRMGFENWSAYEAHLDALRQKTPEARIFSGLVDRCLEAEGQTRTWLAQQVGVTHPTVSRYCNGKRIPTPEVQAKIFDALGLPYQTIDDLFAPKAGPTTP